jgi:ABC-2 type transport system permease protein
MRVFLELARRAARRAVTYRAATLAGLATNVFFGLLRAAVLVALYGQQAEVEGLTVRDAVTYTGLTQALIPYLSLFGWLELMRSVHSGEVGGDLLKPVGLYTYWLARDAGRAVVALALRGLPIMVVYALLFDLSYPPSALGWLALAVSLILAWWVAFGWWFLVNLAAFWSPDAGGFARLAYVVVMFFSGFLMPLRFFPDWVQAAAHATPFPHMVNTVVEVYLGALQGPQLLAALAQQLLWALLLMLLGHLALRLALRRLVVLGG